MSGCLDVGGSWILDMVEGARVEKQLGGQNTQKNAYFPKLSLYKKCKLCNLQILLT